MSTGLKIVGVLLVLLLLIGAGSLLWFRTQSGERVAEVVTERLEATLQGRCKVGGARVLSTRKVMLNHVACTAEQGPLVGFAAVHIEVELDGAALGKLPPVRGVLVDGLHVRIRALPMDMGDDDDSSGDDDDSSGDDDDSADDSLSGTIESLAQRLVRTRDWLNDRPGGEKTGSLLARIADGGVIRIERAAVEFDELPADLPVPSELSAQVSRRGATLEVGVAATLPSGGTVRATAESTPDGLSSGNLQLSDVDLLPLLERTDAFDVQSATLSGAMRFEAGAESWPLELTLSNFTVNHPFLGAEPADLPTVGTSGEIALSDGGLLLRNGRWAISDQKGEIEARLGPLEGQLDAYVHSGGQRLHLGHLLAALPESMLPDGWAKEIQGTMDLQVAFGGPLHDRSKWALDWDADFSRMVLADGELAAQVRRLHRPFSHTIPGSGERPSQRRTIGPTDSHFVAYEDISPWLSAAVVSTEDAGFFGHSGFEVSEIKEAMLENLRDGDGRGGSTITQQLAKNLFLSGERTMSRKLKEALISWRLESDLPKERILEIYLNIAEWGPGIYGIRDAADHYFARTPKVLKPEEAAFLASLLPSPRRYHGYYHARGRGLTQNRQERVHQILDTMLRLGSLDPHQYGLARGPSVELAPCGL